VLAREFGIPVYSWDRRPAGAAAPTEAPAVAPSTSSEPGPAAPAPAAWSTPGDAEKALVALGRSSTIAQIDEHLQQVRRLLATPHLSEQAAARFHAVATSLLGQRRQIERDAEILDDRILKENPAFRRWRAGVLALAKEYPDAARRLVEIVRQLDDEAAA
jgi:hypothetical protein